MRIFHLPFFRVLGWTVLGLAATASAQNGRIEISQSSLNPATSNMAYHIRSPGSYVLTENLAITNNQHGIRIDGTNVTIDLNGFAIAGPTNIGKSGVYADSFRCAIVVKNGFVRNWRGSGIYLQGQAVRVENVMADNCGSGINIAQVAILRDCVVNAPPQADSASVAITAGGLILNCVGRNRSTNTYIYGLANKEPSLAVGCLFEGGVCGIYSDGIAYVRDNTVLRTSYCALMANDYFPRSGARLDQNRVSKAVKAAYLPLGTNMAIRTWMADGVTNSPGGSEGDVYAHCHGLNVSLGTGPTITNANPWANIRY